MLSAPLLNTVKAALVRQYSTGSLVSMLGKLNHVAIACSDMEKTAKFYKDLGVKVSEPVPLPEHGVYTVFVDLGNTKIELLKPYGEKSPIQGFLTKNKDGGIHHICIEVGVLWFTVLTFFGLRDKNLTANLNI